MGVLPNLLIIAILISNCTSAPNGAISYNSIRYYVDDKFHEKIPEEFIFKTWGYRIEDALEAIKSAQEDGVLPGGGVALVRAVKSLEVEVDNEDQRLGVEILKRSAHEPIKQMCINAGESADLIIDKVQSEVGACGYNFKDNKMVDMFEAGILDPTKVTYVALTNAVSVASTLLTTNHAIVEA